MRVYRNLILLCLLIVTPLVSADLPMAPPTCRYGTPHPSAPPEQAQFEFLVGDYAVYLHRWQGDDWSPPQPGVTARWNGRYGLDGMAIVDEWFHPDPAQKPDSGRGINVRMYDPDNAVWKMMWVATTGVTVQDLRARLQDGVLTMWQVYPERANFKATFHVEDEDTWSRVSYVKNDDGSWSKQFKLAARRISCESDQESSRGFPAPPG